MVFSNPKMVGLVCPNIVSKFSGMTIYLQRTGLFPWNEQAPNSIHLAFKEPTTGSGSALLRVLRHTG